MNTITLVIFYYISITGSFTEICHPDNSFVTVGTKGNHLVTHSDCTVLDITGGNGKS